jgi:cytoskeletal protein RodZ
MGGGEPQKNVDVRTMASDLNSIQSGGTPESYTPQTTATPPPAPQTPSATPDNFNFEIPQVPTGMDQVAGNSAPQVPTGKKKGKGALIGLIAFIIVLAVGAVGYFLVYPMFTATKPPAETVTTEQPVATPTTTETTGVPAVVTTTETSTNTTSSSQTTASSTATTTPQAPLAHTSLFGTTDGLINSTSPISGTNLTSLSLGTSKEPALVEVTFTDQNGNLIPFSTLMQSLLSIDLSNSGLTQAFDPTSVSGFVYVDSSGARWLGFVAKLTATSSLVDEKASFAQIFEANTNLKNFFAADPGTEGAWKSGDAATSNRYVLFSKNGYGIDYGWKGDVLVIASSYDGYKAALQDLR